MIFLTFFLFVNVNLLECNQDADESKNLLSIKIIEEPNNYQSMQNMGQLYSGNRRTINEFTHEGKGLKPKFKPANFSGPPQLQELDGQCFEHINNNYRWVVCPFQNVTQYEQNMRWNPYKGILGIFYEWEIINNTFTSLVMLNGDECGSNGNRQTLIKFECNQNETKTEIDKVSEPSTCKYEVILKTYLACNKTVDSEDEMSMNVYPYLKTSLKSEWDDAYSDFVNNLITEKAYNLTLKMIFQAAGFYRKNEELKELEIKADLSETNDNEENEKKSDSNNQNGKNGLKEKLEKCEKENKRLKVLLKLANMSSTDDNAPDTQIQPT